MAPALVEHTVAKERNSSKKYLKKLNCIPPIDIVLVDNIKRIDSKSLLSTNFFGPVMVSKKDNIDVVKKDRIEVSNKMIQHNTPSFFTKMAPVVTNSCLKHDLAYVDSSVSTIPKLPVQVTMSYAVESNQSLCLSTYAASATASSVGTTTTAELRDAQPVAEMNGSALCSYIKKKENMVQLQYGSIINDVSHLAVKVNNLRLKYIYSHLQNRLNAGSALTADSDTLCKKSNHSSLFNATQNLCENNVKLNSVYDVSKYLEENETDLEEDFSSRVKVPISRGKRKNENPTPTPLTLHHWKKRRCKIGSQCSWLSLQIDTLDKKISNLQHVRRKLKCDRQSCRKIQYDHHQSAIDRVDSINKQNIIHSSSSTIPLFLQDDLLTDNGASRTRALTGLWNHLYIRKPFVQPPSEKFKCRDMTSIYACQHCSQSVQKKTDAFGHMSIFDASFHGILSCDYETSLSLLMEETLRREKINTKVKITKSIKKKKKIQSKELPQQILERKISSTSVKSSRKNCRKSEEYGRKRNSADTTGRMRKFRKLSESFSCDSSKPSTPTNELSSPFSQSLNSSSSFRNKQKKLSSSGDYDINNIVIPYSMAASTRVERIQYKEIPTPGWRNIDFEFDERNKDEDPELTDDETFIERHARCEVLERRRFTDFFHLSMNRRRPRLSEGPNSQPPSPLILDESFKSPAGTPADSPSGLNSVRNASVNIQPYLEEERDPPWTFRKFPLAEGDIQNLVLTFDDTPDCLSSQDSDTLASLKEVSQKLLASSTTTSTTPLMSPLTSPTSLSSPSTPAESDINWTVKVLDDQTVDEVTSEKNRKGIVLKLAKK